MFRVMCLPHRAGDVTCAGAAPSPSEVHTVLSRVIQFFAKCQEALTNMTFLHET